MQYERLVGLNITNDEVYQQYRTAMKPILESYGGGFGYDFKVSEVLFPEAEKSINRVFTIYFPSQKAMDEFFSNSDYKKVRNLYFKPSVAETFLLASYKKENAH